MLAETVTPSASSSATTSRTAALPPLRSASFSRNFPITQSTFMANPQLLSARHMGTVPGGREPRQGLLQLNRDTPLRSAQRACPPTGVRSSLPGVTDNMRNWHETHLQKQS